MQLAAGPGLCPAETWHRWKAAGDYAALFAKSPKWYCKEKYSKFDPWLIDKSQYMATPAGFVGRVRVSLQSVVNHATIPEKCLRTYLDINQGADEYVITSAILWADALSSAGHHRVACACLHVPLAEWVERDIVKIETIARHSLHLEHDTNPAHNKAHTLVGRIKTLLGRDLRQHDVLAEIEERRYASRPHHYADDDSRMRWIQDLASVLKRTVEQSMNAMPNIEQSLESWWETRIAWLPNGTSSDKNRDRWPAKLRNCTYLTNSKSMMLGPNKAEWLTAQIHSKPMMTCRAATKNEPGKKRRPLRASDDTSYAIQAYASSNLEKFFSHDGAVMRQTPEDVREATQAVGFLKNKAQQMILCLDYSDFNLTHTTITRCLYNVTLALQYSKRHNAEKARAALWVAKAQLQHWLDGTLSNQGLSSGERDTARDNTMLHQAYAMLVEKSLQRQGLYTKPAMRRLCGDDEICIGMHWASAIDYYMEHRQQGHDLQARKTLCSSLLGEFLQYNMHAESVVPTMPLPPNINNFVSGSWYKTSNYDPYEYPAQVSSAAASCIRRGCRPELMRRLCAATCRWLASGTPWRRNLLATPLFGSLGDYTRSPLTAKEAIDAVAPKPHAGVDDYVQRIRRKYNFSSEELSVIKDAAIELAFASACITYCNHTKEVTSVNETNDIEKLPEENIKKEMSLTHDVYKTWIIAERPQRHDALIWLGVQLGLPPKLINRIGMLNTMRSVNNAGRAAVNDLVATTGIMSIAPELYAMLPGALTTYFNANLAKVHNAAPHD